MARQDSIIFLKYLNNIYMNYRQKNWYADAGKRPKDAFFMKEFCFNLGIVLHLTNHYYII